MIISGGENVYPSEVEQVLGAHPKIKDRGCHWRPSREVGRGGPCSGRLHQDQDASESDILDWCKDRIAGYKRPKSISFIAEDEMPRTATGKLLHRVLRSRYANHEARALKGVRHDGARQANEALSGVVMGKTAGAALAGEGAA